MEDIRPKRDDLPELLTKEQVRQLLQLKSLRSVDPLLRKSGIGVIKLSPKQFRYSKAELIQWLDNARG